MDISFPWTLLGALTRLVSHQYTSSKLQYLILISPVFLEMSATHANSSNHLHSY